MKEKDFQRLFRKYIEGLSDELRSSILGSVTNVFELKIAKKTSLPFKNIQPHQVEALFEAKHDHYYYKITDSPVSWGADTKMRYTEKKPFDCIVFNETRSWLVIWFYKPRQLKVMYWIDIDDYIKMAKEADRMSMTEEMAQDYATYTLQFVS